MGEDMLEIRIDFFVLRHNLSRDAKRGLQDSATTGMPHELRFINELAKGVLKSTPFPSAASLTDGTPDAIDEKSDLYEAHGFGYYKSVRERETARKANAARAAAAASSSSDTPPAAKSNASGKRATKAKKGPTQNLLNSSPLKPETPAEVELMLKCVQEAMAAKKPKKGTMWDLAADHYLKGFIANCAVAEEERQLIRASTTAEMIKSSYEEMGARHREYVHRAAKGELPVAQMPDMPLVPMPPAAVSEPAAAASSTAEGGDASAADGAQAAASSSAAKPASKDKRQLWKERIEGGRPLTMGEVDTLGSKPSAAYLRAMGVKVDRSEQKDLDAMHKKLRDALEAAGLSVWSVRDRQGA